jgi:hypothetical protein
MSATNITSKCRIASIELDDAMILAHVANPRWIKFSEGTAVRRDKERAAVRRKIESEHTPQTRHCGAPDARLPRRFCYTSLPAVYEALPNGEALDSSGNPLEERIQA